MLKAQVYPDLQRSHSGLIDSNQLNWLNRAKSFADSVSLEDVIRADKTNAFRRDLFELACQEGFGALPFPKTYGGTGSDYVSFCLVNEVFASRCIPIMSSLGVHVLCQEPIYRFGTEGQKKRYLIPSSTGKYLAAFGLTEPSAGSDTAALKTTAELYNDEYVLNGTKTFITSGGAADYFIVMARLKNKSEIEPAGAKTITAFIVEKGFPGFAVGQKFDMVGMRGYSTCEIVFNNCRVPKENLLGDPGMGRKVALSSLAKGRVTIAAQAIGWAQAALDTLSAHLAYRVGSEPRDRDLNGLDYLIGELTILLASARALTYEAARKIDFGESDVTMAAMAKVQATDAAVRITTESMSALGYEAFKPELLLERIFRDAKVGQIYEGTNQIQRLLIARSLLK